MRIDITSTSTIELFDIIEKLTFNDRKAIVESIISDYYCPMDKQRLYDKLIKHDLRPTK